MIDVNYEGFEEDLESGAFRARLKEELVRGFETMRDEGERLPPASHYASRIAEIVHQSGGEAVGKAYEIYQEILIACEEARAEVLGEDEQPPPAPKVEVLPPN